MNEPTKRMAKALRWNHMTQHWNHYISTAQEKDFSHTQLIEFIIQEEYHAHEEKALASRLKRAKIPEHLVMETFPFERQPQLNKKKILDLHDSDQYLQHHRNIIWIGPTGTGKTGLATAFLIQAIQKGYRGLFITFPELIDKLYKSVADHSEKNIIRKFAAYDCLLIDEMGYIEMETAQINLFFHLMTKRHRKKSTLLTSNLGFSDWPSFLKNKQLTAALIDRLTENTHVINMEKCKSIRKKLPIETI